MSQTQADNVTKSIYLTVLSSSGKVLEWKLEGCAADLSTVYVVGGGASHPVRQESHTQNKLLVSERKMTLPQIIYT